VETSIPAQHAVGGKSNGFQTGSRCSDEYVRSYEVPWAMKRVSSMTGLSALSQQNQEFMKKRSVPCLSWRSAGIWRRLYLGRYHETGCLTNVEGKTFKSASIRRCGHTRKRRRSGTGGGPIPMIWDDGANDG